jgi:hypothetical protein
MDEKSGNENQGRRETDKMPRRAFILTENTVVYTAEGDESKKASDPQPSVISIQSHLPVDLLVTVRDRVIKIIEMVLAVATFIVVVYYTRAAYLQAQASIEATYATQQAAVAAVSSANTAATALGVSQQQFRQEQRPYLWATPDIAEKTQDRSKQLVITEGDSRFIVWVVHIKNGGRSPAKDEVNTQSETHIVDKDSFTRDVSEFIPQYPNVPGGIVAPETSATVITGHWPSISNEDFKRIESGERVIYVIGAVKYRDIFSPTIPPYETRYCFVYNPTGMAFGACPQGNTIK